MPDNYFKGAAGGRKRAQTIDENVSAMATGGRTSSPGTTAPRTSSPQRRQPAQPSSYAPSGEPPQELTFGTPLQDVGPRLSNFAAEHAAELREQETEKLRRRLTQ